MSTRADIIDLLDNATEDALEKILAAAKEILREGKDDKVYTLEEIRAKAVPIAKKKGKIKSAFDYIDFIYDLEGEFGCHVDLVSYGISDKKFLAEIQQDEVILYAG